MTDAPRRIVAWPGISGWLCGTWSQTRYPEDGLVYIRADLIDMDVLASIEILVDKLAAAWFCAMQNNKDQHMTLGELGALAKYHLTVSALSRSEQALTDLRAMMEKLK